jgi:hypothetical protein
MKILRYFFLPVILFVNASQVGATENIQNRPSSQDTITLLESITDVHKNQAPEGETLASAATIDNRITPRKEVDFGTEIFIYFLIILVYSLAWFKDYLNVQARIFEHNKFLQDNIENKSK